MIGPLLLSLLFYSGAGTAQPVLPEKVEIQADLGTGFVTLPDFFAPIQISGRGIQGSSQRDRVASTGEMTFQLDNSASNSQGELGLYSPNHANHLLGWEIGIPIRCIVTNLGVPEPVFVGTVSAIEPVPGKRGARRVAVSCVDWMDEAATATVTGVAVQVGKRSDQVLSALVAAVERQPAGVDISAGADIYPFALDNARGDELKLLSEFQRLMQSELGYLFVQRDGTLKFQSRFRRPNIQTLSERLGDQDLVAVETSRGREHIINRTQIQVHPRRVDTAPVVLFSLASTPEILRKTSTTLRALYRDPLARATRAGGIEMVAPVATTDYAFNTKADGTGTDITSQLSVVAVFGGNEADVTVTNNGPMDGFLIKLELRGKGVYDYETVLATAESQASKTKYGERVFGLDMPYQGDLVVAQDAAAFIVAQSKSLLTQVTGVTFRTNREQRLLNAALRIDIGERVRVEETVLGTAAVVPVGESRAVTALEFFINGVDLTISQRGVITCKWTLAPADPFSYWLLEVPGFTELNETTRLGYGIFIAGWILGESVLGTSTKLD